MKGVPSSELLADLIGQVYDAACQPADWDRFLLSLAQAFGCGQMIMVQIDRRRTDPERVITAGIDLELIGHWRECKEHVDVWYQRVFSVPEGNAYLGTQLVTRNDLRRSGFHADILRQSQVEYCMGGIPENNLHRQTVIATYNSARRGDFSEEQRRAFSYVLPHVRRAFDVERRLGTELDLRPGGGAALERSPYGLIALDRHGYVLALNAKADRVLREGDGLSVRAGLLCIADQTCQAKLNRLVAHCTGLPDLVARAAGGFAAVVRPSGCRPYHLHVSPVSARVGDLQFAPSVACMVMLHDPEAAVQVPLEFLVEVYGLTAAEARLCAALFRERSLQDTIDGLGISRNTAKTQLAQIYMKVGVESQSQLLRQLALGFRLQE